MKMFVAEALDEMMAGTLLADVNGPLKVNALAPVNDIAVCAELGIALPDMFITAADVHVNPIAPDPPAIDPDTLILVAVVDIPTAAAPPVTLPVIVKDVPVNNIPTATALVETKSDVIFPITVRLPDD